MAFTWVGLLAAIVALFPLNGRGREHGVLAQRVGPHQGQTSPERVQLLLFTIATPAMWLASMLV